MEIKLFFNNNLNFYKFGVNKMEFNRINNKTGNKTQAFQSYSIVFQLKEETQNDKLFTAVSEGDLNTIKSLLTKNLGLIEAKNKFGSSPLHYATWWGQLPLVEYLVEQGADLNTKDIFDQTFYMRQHGMAI